MTGLRTAAQQALKALELAQTDVHWELNSPTRKFLRKAEKNLRAALAEPTTEESSAVEPVQEPVAKVELMTTGGNAGLATRIVEIDDHFRDRLRPGQLLYTAPPQRKPLVDPAEYDDAGAAERYNRGLK